MMNVDTFSLAFSEISCCCYLKKPKLKDEDLIYINSLYEIERFDFKKSRIIDDDYRKTINRVRRSIQLYFDKMPLPVNLDKNGFLTYGDIKKINEALKIPLGVYS